MSEMILVHQIGDGLPPRRAKRSAAGIDLAVPAAVVVRPGDIVRVDLGVGVSVPDGCYGRLAARSSSAGRGLVVLGGVIDRDYTGPLVAVLGNCGREPISFEKNHYAVQLVCERCSLPDIVRLTDRGWARLAAASERKDAGFGSTGV